MKRPALLIALAALLAGCSVETYDYSSDSATRKRFQDPVVLTDANGVKYVVEHWTGDTYTVKALKEPQ